MLFRQQKWALHQLRRGTVLEPRSVE